MREIELYNTVPSIFKADKLFKSLIATFYEFLGESESRCIVRRSVIKQDVEEIELVTWSTDELVDDPLIIPLEIRRIQRLLTMTQNRVMINDQEIRFTLESEIKAYPDRVIKYSLHFSYSHQLNLTKDELCLNKSKIPMLF
jgi:hypothetical protein